MTNVKMIVGTICFTLLCSSLAQRSHKVYGQEKLADDTAKSKERAAQMKEMRERVNKFAVIMNNQTVDLHENPLLRFDDPTREFHDGTIWAFGLKGRPVALGTVEKYKSFWSHELISLSSLPITATGVQWNPKVPSLKWTKISRISSDVEDTGKQLFKIKTFLMQLAVSEYLANGQRFQLRFLPRRIHKYSDEKVGIREGAIFVFANGRNPEATAIVEHQRDKDDQMAWHVAFAPLTSAGVIAKFEDRVIWEKPYVPVPQRSLTDTYINNFR